MVLRSRLFVVTVCMFRCPFSGVREFAMGLRVLVCALLLCVWLFVLWFVCACVCSCVCSYMLRLCLCV